MVSLEQFDHYILNSYYVFDDSGMQEYVIEERKQKFRVCLYNGEVVVTPRSAYTSENLARATEIYKEITAQKNWGQFEEID